MNISRRGFLKLLAALPGAAAIASLPQVLVAAEVLPSVVDVVEAPALHGNVVSRLRGMYIEVGDVRVAIGRLSITSQCPVRIDVTKMMESREFVYGLPEPGIVEVSTTDPAANKLRDLFYDGEAQTIRIVMDKPNEMVFTTRGVISMVRVCMPNAGLMEFEFNLSLTELVDVSAIA